MQFNAIIVTYFKMMQVENRKRGISSNLWRLELNNGLKRFPVDFRKITEVQEAICTFITHRSADIKEVFNALPNAYKETL